MNHTTTIGIGAILALALFTPALLAASTAYAREHGDGDSVSIKSKFKQKNICWAIDDSRTTCRNDASVFGAREENNNQNLQCPEEVEGIAVEQTDATCTVTGPTNVITGGVCNDLNGERTVSGGQNPQATCTFPATRA